MRTDYADDTWLETNDGYIGGYRRGRALCDDGVTRAVRFPKGGNADTMFSVPACCTALGKYVDGFVTVTTRSGSDVPTDDDPKIVRFHANASAKNAGVIKATEPAAPVRVVEVTEHRSALDDMDQIEVRIVEASHREFADKRPWQHDHEGDRIHYIVIEDGIEKRLWCEPGHADYDEVLERLTAPVRA